MEQEEIVRKLKKADEIFREAKTHKKNREYDLSVRRSQEAFELYLKTFFQV